MLSYSRKQEENVDDCCFFQSGSLNSKLDCVRNIYLHFKGINFKQETQTECKSSLIVRGFHLWFLFN